MWVHAVQIHVVQRSTVFRKHHRNQFSSWRVVRTKVGSWSGYPVKADPAARPASGFVWKVILWSSSRSQVNETGKNVSMHWLQLLGTHAQS